MPWVEQELPKRPWTQTDGSATQILVRSGAGARQMVWAAANNHTHIEAHITDLDHYDSADFTTDFATKTTSNLDEGTNLYYTEARVTANASVTANTTHRNITSGNPHGVSHSNIGTGTLANLNSKLTDVTLGRWSHEWHNTAPVTNDEEHAGGLGHDGKVIKTIARGYGSGTIEYAVGYVAATDPEGSVTWLWGGAPTYKTATAGTQQTFDSGFTNDEFSDENVLYIKLGTVGASVTSFWIYVKCELR